LNATAVSSEIAIVVLAVAAVPGIAIAFAAAGSSGSGSGSSAIVVCGNDSGSGSVIATAGIAIVSRIASCAGIVLFVFVCKLIVQKLLATARTGGAGYGAACTSFAGVNTN
jgi:hypothetical protein